MSAPSSTAHRRVRHLHVAAQRNEHATHARVLLEDALRTASIDDTGRLIIVRRLDLGPISTRATATALSLQLEKKLSALPSSLVSVHSTASPRASAVYFTSAEEPWYLLAERTARGLPCNDWYWPLALPNWNRHQPANDTLRQAFRTLATLPNGLAHTIHLANLLSTQRALPALLHALTSDDIPFSLGTAGLQPGPTPAPPQPTIASATAQSTTPFAPLIRNWGPQDPRTLWLTHYLAATRSFIPSLPTPNIHQPAPTPSTRESVSPAETTTNPVKSPELFPPINSLTTPSSETKPSHTPTSLNKTSNPPPPISPSASEEEQPLDPTPAQPLFLDRVFTHAGGLFFLIPLLQRLNFPAHLATLPESDRQPYAWEFFLLALRHARITTDDPIYQLIPLSTSRLTPSPSQSLFLLRAHRQSLRLSALTLRQLIRRPALFSSTPTHIDLFFRANEADLRLRRAALDVDPGWLRWLSRLISYHYTRED